MNSNEVRDYINNVGSNLHIMVYVWTKIFKIERFKSEVESLYDRDRSAYSEEFLKSFSDKSMGLRLTSDTDILAAKLISMVLRRRSEGDEELAKFFAGTDRKFKQVYKSLKSMVLHSLLPAGKSDVDSVLAMVLACVMTTKPVQLVDNIKINGSEKSANMLISREYLRDFLGTLVGDSIKERITSDTISSFISNVPLDIKRVSRAVIGTILPEEASRRNGVYGIDSLHVSKNEYSFSEAFAPERLEYLKSLVTTYSNLSDLFLDEYGVRIISPMKIEIDKKMLERVLMILFSEGLIFEGSHVKSLIAQIFPYIMLSGVVNSIPKERDIIFNNCFLEKVPVPSTRVESFVSTPVKPEESKDRSEVLKLEKELASKIEELRNINGRLEEANSLLIEKDRENSKLRLEVESFSDDREELNELRSMAYKREESELQSNRESYSLESMIEDLESVKVVVVGGFQGWISKMKEVLPSARFLPVAKKVNYPLDSIASADVVFFVESYISHKIDEKADTFRAKIIDLPRRVNIKLCIRDMHRLAFDYKY